MSTNRFKLWWLLLVVPFLIGCPFGEEPCPFNDWERITTIEDLIFISPMKDSFSQGEIVTFELTIPDSIFIYDKVISLNKETGDISPKLITHSELFNNNILDFKYGLRGSEKNWFHLEYLPEKEIYSLEVLVSLKRLGEYRIATATNETIFRGKEKCNWYEVRTRLEGTNGGPFLEFVVVP
jgi:hypothetical protein